MAQSLDSYSNEYYKEYMKGYRKAKKDEAIMENENKVEFQSKKISIAQFRKHYKDKIENKEQELIFGNCLDLLVLIDNYKKAIEEEGTHYKNTTGNIKINPVVKEHRDTIKSFTNLLCVLHSLLEPDESKTKQENRFMKFVK